MRSTLEALEGNKVRLSIDVDEDEFEGVLEQVFRTLAREVRIPGFRPGKAPRKVLEARLGKGAAREEALRTALPDYYEQAVIEHDVDAIAPPDIDLTAGQEAGGVSFDAVVEIRPEVQVAGYDSLRVTIADPRPADTEVDAQLQRLRDRFATYEPSSAPARPGDQATIDIEGSQGGEPLGGLTAQDYDYEVGSGAVVPEVDEQLTGAQAGDILEFDAAHPAGDEVDPLHFRILVKEVQARVLPDLDDSFAVEASEHATLADLRAEIERSIRIVKAAQAQMQLRDATARALADLVDIELPDALVAVHAEHRLQDMALRARAQGLSLDQYLAMTGQSPQQVGDDLKEAAAVAARVDLALRAVVRDEHIEVDDEAIDAELAAVAERGEGDPATLRAELERDGRLGAVRSDLAKRAALEWLVERVEIVDEDGAPLDRSLLEIADAAPEADTEPDAEPDSQDPRGDAGDDVDDTDRETADQIPSDGAPE